MKYLASLALALALLGVGSIQAFAATDVAVLDGLEFSTETFFAGDTVRVYATIRNAGDSDVTGVVNFYLPGGQIGSGLNISMPKGGLKEEVFTDFIVPEGDFNIRVEIANIQPPDTNTANNETLTPILEPIPDADRDRIADAQDNCPATAGADQRDLDMDGQGNMCDNDIDGDGLTNAQEETKGTDGWDADTDDDGVGDATDPKPLGEPLKVPEPTPAPTPTTQTSQPETQTTSSSEASSGSTPSSVSSTSESSSPEGADSTGDSSASSITPSVGSATNAGASEPEQVPLSSENSLFTYEDIRWGTYNFRVVAPAHDDGYRYEWDFGDGTTSTRREVTHAYGRAGTFTAALRVTDPGGVMTEDTIEVHIPFFDLDNRSIRMLLIFLVILLLIGLSAFYRLGQTPTSSREEAEPPAQKTPRKRSSKS